MGERRVAEGGKEIYIGRRKQRGRGREGGKGEERERRNGEPDRGSVTGIHTSVYSAHPPIPY